MKYSESQILPLFGDLMCHILVECFIKARGRIPLHILALFIIQTCERTIIGVTECMCIKSLNLKMPGQMELNNIQTKK